MCRRSPISRRSVHPRGRAKEDQSHSITLGRSSRSSKQKNPRAFQRLSIDVSLSEDRRHDQSNGVNSVSATAGCSLFWTTVHGSVPTDAWVIRSIFRPQSQMPMEDAFCMMTSLLRGHYTGGGCLFQRSVGQRFPNRRPFATDSARKTR
jgi:hypothetical protein